MFNEQFTHLNLDLDETLSLCIIRFNSLSLSIKIQVSLSLPASLPPSICLSGHPSYPTALPLPSPLSLPMLTLSFYHELDQYSLFPLPLGNMAYELVLGSGSNFCPLFHLFPLWGPQNTKLKQTHKHIYTHWVQDIDLGSSQIHPSLMSLQAQLHREWMIWVCSLHRGADIKDRIACISYKYISEEESAWSNNFTKAHVQPSKSPMDHWNLCNYF